MMINPFECYERPDEWHDVISVSLAELSEGGFYDVDDDSWKWDYYSEEQYNRVCQKFKNRYWLREVSVLPPKQWKREYLRVFNEIMPKYKPLYKAIDDGANILSDGDSYGKSRDIYSDFPQTRLGNNQDYASNGRDREYESINVGNFVDSALSIKDKYNDIDVMILDECKCLFSCLYSVSMNGL